MERIIDRLSNTGPVKITALQTAVLAYLNSLGFNRTEQAAIAANIMEAEFCGKNTHGLLRLELLKILVEQGKIIPDSPKPSCQRKSPNYLLVNGKGGTGYAVLALSLEQALHNYKQHPIQIVGLTNTAPSTGYFGAFARTAALNKCVFIGFSNSAGGLVPHGSRDALWGLNPTAIGLPFKNDPIVIDFSAGSTTWGSLMKHANENEPMPVDVAVDVEGTMTRNPKAAMLGGIVPFGGQKGSAIAFFIEIIAGIMTGSRAGKSVVGGWGTYYILLNPYAFISAYKYHYNLRELIKELKFSRCATAGQEIFFPGERSGLLRKQRTAKGMVDVDLTLYEQIVKSVDQL